MRVLLSSFAVAALVGSGSAGAADVLGKSELAALKRLAVGETAVLEGFAGPGREAPIVRRVDVYAPGAKIYVVADDGPREVPRSDWLHFVALGGREPVALSLSPDGSRLEGAIVSGGELRALSGRLDGEGRLAIETRDAKRAGDVDVESQCLAGLDAPASQVEPLAQLRAQLAPLVSDESAPPQDDTPRAKIALRQLTVALDTDNEFMLERHADNVPAATAHLATIFVQLALLYEQSLAVGGLELRVLQGTTFLRPSTVADPYTDTFIVDQLSEFSEYWRDNNAGVDRALAMMISGKEPNPNTGTGIAWLIPTGNICSFKGSTGGSLVSGHYSLVRALTIPTAPIAADLRLVGHEFGHGLGTYHTHCQRPDGTAPATTGTIDQCFSGEGGGTCYTGPTTCPPGGVGSIMSYCDFIPGCARSTLVFHASHSSIINRRIVQNLPTCITVVPPPASTNGAIDAGTIVAPEGNDGADAFATSLSITDDLVVVGAPFAGSAQAGKVFVYARASVPGSYSRDPKASGSAIELVGAEPVAEFALEKGVVGNKFGQSVAISRDGGTIAIGVPGIDAVHVMRRPPAGWGREAVTISATLTPSPAGGTTPDAFGETVAIADDGTIVVGAPASDVGAAVDAGAVYAFRDMGTSSFPPLPELRASTPQGGATFGFALAMGNGALVIGAPEEDAGGFPDIGAAYVFDMVAGSFGAAQRVANAGGSVGDKFGQSVATRDGVIVVGAPSSDCAPGEPVDARGRAAVFRDDGPSVSAVTTLVPDTNAMQAAGCAVATNGDVIAVGAPMAPVAGEGNRGRGYLYEIDAAVAAPTTMTPRGIVEAEGGEGGDFFALAIAVSERAVVFGSPYDDRPLTDTDEYTDQGRGEPFVFDRILKSSFE